MSLILLYLLYYIHLMHELYIYFVASKKIVSINLYYFTQSITIVLKIYNLLTAMYLLATSNFSFHFNMHNSNNWQFIFINSAFTKANISLKSNISWLLMQVIFYFII
jgi:hypothetical protein